MSPPFRGDVPVFREDWLIHTSALISMRRRAEDVLQFPLVNWIMMDCCIIGRVLEDGRLGAVAPRLDDAELLVGTWPPRDPFAGFQGEQRWTYRTTESAVEALANWNPRYHVAPGGDACLTT